MRKDGVIMFMALILFLLLIEETMMAQNTTLQSVNVGVVIDMETDKQGLSCIKMALSHFYATHSHYKTRLLIINTTRDSMDDVIDAAAAVVDLIKNVEVQAIIGPTTSMQAEFLMDIGKKAQVPIISYSATIPSLTEISARNQYFFRATQSDLTQVRAITAIIKDFGWREAVLIYVDNDYGQGIIPYLIDALQEINTRISNRSAISPLATDDQIVKELYKLMTMQTRVFIVHISSPSLGSRFFTHVRNVGMMNKGYVWIMADGLTNVMHLLTPTAINSMKGVLGVRPYVPETKELENFLVRWKRKFQQENSELTVYGLWAYDAAIALAMAIEEAGVSNFGYQKTNVSSSSYSDLATLGVSRNGPGLVRALSDITFKGLAGDFSLVNGQLPSSAFQVINVIGDYEAREVGLWTPENGLVEKPSSVRNSNSTSRFNRSSIIWPGNSNSVPKGWEFPTNGKKLKIGVPVKEGYTEFVKVNRDNSTNTATVTGYCIEVFDAAVKKLPYAVSYEYIPFAKPDGSSAGTYNDLVYQVHLQKYDAVVGDITIIANRSLYVDFTLPFTVSGVSMVVPIEDNKSKNAWVFLKPLTWDLWLTSFCFFIFIGFAVWVLEHRINEDFRGPPSHQAGTAFWFSFSTMVFAHREIVVSNLARIVVTIWCFVVLILTQSYTASLTSLLTVQQLMPTVTDVNQLIKNGENVGYLKDSFVVEILKNLGFDQSKLKEYQSVEECYELFSKGSANGGIAAAFDEVPYVKLFLARYCSKYAMVEPTFKTGGFGFVFPKGSPLVPDLSRAILKVIEGERLKNTEKSYFGKQSSCPDPSTSVSSDSLSLKSFWGLFLIAGVATFLALMINAVMFIYQHWQLFVCSDSESSLRSRIFNLFRIFDQKDLKSHKFRKSELNGANISPNMMSTSSSSPSIYSVRTEFPIHEVTPSPDYYGPGLNLPIDTDLNSDQHSRDFPTIM